MTATPDVLTLTFADPTATIHLLAPIGAETEALEAAPAMLVDPALDASFAAAPLQASPVAIPSGTWTQGLYQVGDDIVAAISLERGGYTVLLLAQATQPAFMQVANAAVNQLLLGMEVLVTETSRPDASGPRSTWRWRWPSSTVSWRRSPTGPSSAWGAEHGAG